MLNRRVLGGLIALVICLVVASTPAVANPTDSAVPLAPRWVRAKPLHTEWDPGRHLPLVVLKCAEGSGVRLRESGLISLTGTPLHDLDQVLAIHGQPPIRRLFSRPEEVLDSERASGQLMSGQSLADLNLYFLLLPQGNEGSSQLVDDLNALPVVELAYFEPIPAHGAIHGDPSATGPDPEKGGETPDFSALQLYLEPAPWGLAPASAWAYAGGKGQGVRLGLLERGLNPNHEDLTDPLSWSGDKVDLHHGTAVLGEILGQHNGFGVSGIAPDTELHVSIFDTEAPYPVVADALNLLGRKLDAGDVLLIEYHAQGPPSGETCECSCYSFEYLPLEYWQANFDAIATVTANGVVCVEIAGNGSMDLDHPRYGGAFDRAVRDSGAILVGAGLPGSGDPACWTNHGRRIDLHGHSGSIVTAGYGLLYNGGPDATYTDMFGGTSGAGAMVAGAVCALQGWHLARTGLMLSTAEILQRFVSTGTPQGSSARLIGPFPNLHGAIHGPEAVLKHAPSRGSP